MASSKFDGFKTHRPVDSSDPGFTVPGHKLRWLSGRAREQASTSMLYSTFKKSELPKSLIDHIERCYPGAFSAGDTIRRGSGELVLAYTTDEMQKRHRLELDATAREQASRANIMPKQERIGDGKKDFAKITDYEESVGSVPSQFLNKKQSE